MQSMWTASRDRSNNRGVASFSIHFYLLFCMVCFTPMRFPRIKAEGQSFYHCVSRVVDRQFIFQTAGHGSPEAERFVLLMRRLEAFSGVRVLTYSLMSISELFWASQMPSAGKKSASSIASTSLCTEA